MGVTKAYCPGLLDNIIPLFTLYELAQKRVATVTVTPRKSKIAYKYPNEDWIEIDADDFTLEKKYIGDSIEFPRYFITCEATVNGRFPATESRPLIFADGQTVKGKTRASFSGVDLSSVSGNYDSSFVEANFNYVAGSSYSAGEKVEDTNCFYRNISWSVSCDEEEFNQPFYNRKSTSSSLGVTNLRNFGLELDTSYPSRKCYSTVDKCTFKATKCGEIVYEETREVCPEVNKYICGLDGNSKEEIEVELNNFEVLFIAKGVVNISEVFSILNILNSTLNMLPFDNFVLDYLKLELGGNLEECLIIFICSPNSLPTSSQIIDFSTIKIIKQICSDCNCPPPYFEVVCDTKECPPNTCAVDCGDHICCYNSEGISIKSIKK